MPRFRSGKAASGSGKQVHGSSRRFLHFAVAADQIISRAVMLQLRLGPPLNFGDNALGEDFAQLHAPLIERINVPYRPLSEDIVLVESDQFSQSGRR